MAHNPDSRLSPTAVLALVAGIFSFICFFVFMGVAGIAAVVLGFVALSEIKRSEGRLHGDGAAITGIVLARSVEPGQTVTAGYQTPILFTLAKDLSQMQLKIDVDEADVGKVRDGQGATFVVDAYPKQSFASEVVRLSNLPKTGTTVITYEGTESIHELIVGRDLTGHNAF